LTGRAFARAWWGIFAVWAALLWLAEPWDLELSRRVVDRTSAFGWFMDVWAPLPSIVFALGCAARLLVGRITGQASGPRSLQRATVVFALLVPLGIIHGLKWVWGRVRFRDLAPGATDFTSVWTVAGVAGATSFPSGHTATAMLFVVLPMWLWSIGRQRAAAVAWAVCLGWGIAMAWGRIVSGAHYLTDTLFSIGASILLAALVWRGMTLPCNR
jgi:membrane-associated phospholipid phosphatase